MKLLVILVLFRMVAPADSVPSQKSNTLVRREAANNETEESNSRRRVSEPDYILTINPFSKSHESLSFPARPLLAQGQNALSKKKDKFAYVTMCILGQLGAREQQIEVAECLNSICSLRKSTPSSQDNTVVMVNSAGIAALRAPLQEFGVKVVELPALQWSKDQKRYPEPKRAYSFYKLHAWRLIGYERIFWFDQDVFFLRDAQAIVDKNPGPGFAAAHFPLDAGFCSSKYYINSGVMLFEPSMPVYLKLVDRWMLGNYTPAPLERGGHGEQDVLCSAYPDILGNLTEVDNCFNYRGYWFQHCDVSKLVLLHGHHEKKKCTNTTKPSDLYGLFSFDFSGLEPFIDETLYLRLQNNASDASRGMLNGTAIAAAAASSSSSS